MERSMIGHTNCFICLGIKELLIHKQCRKVFDNEPLITDMEPCDKCKEHMKNGIIIVRTKDGKSFSGTYSVIKEESDLIQNMEPKELKESVVKIRICFMDEETYDKLFKKGKE